MTSRAGKQQHRERAAWQAANPGAPRVRTLTPEDADAAAGLSQFAAELAALEDQAAVARADYAHAKEQAKIWKARASDLHRLAQHAETLAARFRSAAPAVLRLLEEDT